MSREIRAAQKAIEILIRSLMQIKKEPNNFWEEFLFRSGQSIVSGAKARAPVDRGALRRAISFRLKKAGLGLEVGVLGGDARGVPYGRIIELGGTIKRRKSRWLAIPLDTKYQQRTPRSFDLTFVTLGAKKFMVDRQTGEVAYRLKKTVTIPAQPYLKPAIEEYRNRNFKKLMNKVMDKYLGGL